MAREVVLTVDVEAVPDRVFGTLTTIQGLAAFWTPEVSGEPTEGGDLRFGFATAPVDLEIEVGAADVSTGTVGWQCHGPWPYWKGTAITWQVIGADPVKVHFAHRGWDEEQPEIEFGFIAYTWAMVLQALKSYSESGVPAPALS